MSTEAAADLHFYLVGALAAYPEPTANRILEAADVAADAIEREAAAAAIERVRAALHAVPLIGGNFIGHGTAWEKAAVDAILDAEAQK